MMTDEHETPDETAARIMADLLTPSVPAGLSWPAPQSNPHCICRPNPLAIWSRFVAAALFTMENAAANEVP